MDTSANPVLPLATVFASQRLSEPCVIALLSSLLGPLEALHLQGITHGNISPASILWTRETGATLGPVTSARYPAEDGSLRLQVRPGYTPMEVYQAQGNIGPWSDVYALGALAHWLITGATPPDAPSRSLHDSYRPLALATESGYSMSLRGLVDTLLALQPEQRPREVAEIARRLAPLLATSEPPQPLPAANFAYAPDPEQLNAVRSLLTQHLLGPVASALVNQAIRKSRDWPSFCNAVAAHLENEKLRAEFLERFANASSPRTSAAAAPSAAAPSGAAAPAPATFPAAMLDVIETELKDTLGAVARIVIRQAARQAPDQAALFKAIAAEIENPHRARTFLAWAETTLGTSREQ